MTEGTNLLFWTDDCISGISEDGYCHVGHPVSSLSPFPPRGGYRMMVAPRRSRPSLLASTEQADSFINVLCTVDVSHH